MEKEILDVGNWRPNLPGGEELKKQSLKYIALSFWVRNHLVEVASARLALKTAYAAYRQWCTLSYTPGVPIQAFNGLLSSRISEEWPTVRQRRTAKGIIYINLTLKAWVEVVPSPPPGGTHPSKVVP